MEIVLVFGNHADFWGFFWTFWLSYFWVVSVEILAIFFSPLNRADFWSMVLYFYRAAVRELLQQGRKVAVTCTTGMATLQFREFEACTIHHWAGLYDGRYSKEDLARLLLGSDKYSDIRDRIRNCDVLVIDEIGLLSRHIFETVEYVCRTVKDNNCLFGSIQVVASGSLCLPC